MVPLHNGLTVYPEKFVSKIEQAGGNSSLAEMLNIPDKKCNKQCNSLMFIINWIK